MTRHHFSVFALAAILGAVAGSAQDKPNFSGEWVLNLSKSTLARKGIEGGTARIVHREPAFSFSRTFVTHDGPDDASYELAIDGSEKAEHSGTMTRHSRLYWEGDQLVLDEKIAMGDRNATNIVHYSLTGGGATLVAKESFRGPKLKYDNVWLFDRKK